MHRTVVLLVVGLTQDLLGEHTPNLSALARSGTVRPLETVTPAVTCSVQATMMTGLLPRDHGIVGNGWYFRDQAEVWLWRQSANLYRGERIREAAKKRDPAFTSAKLFWWYNMYDTADIALTPRPMYPADGRKVPDHWAHPPELRAELDEKLGKFPLFFFWGPRADLRSSRWIADSARHVFDTRKPTLSLVYLPHLDYCLQKFGPRHPEIPKHLREIDALAGELIEHVRKEGARVIALSEYGITEVRDAVHPNRVLRQAGMLGIREELGREILEPGGSEAFAIADHQIAHVYVRNPARIAEVRALFEKLDGVEHVLDEEGKQKYGLDHERSGELVLLSKADRWFSYYYWLDDDRAPDFARTVDIHRKPGYDPVELFIDPKITLPMLRIVGKIARSKMGFRTLMDVIPLDTSLVRGSHGRITDDPRKGPLWISTEPDLVPETMRALDVKDVVLRHVFG